MRELKHRYFKNQYIPCNKKVATCQKCHAIEHSESADFRRGYGVLSFLVILVEEADVPRKQADKSVLARLVHSQLPSGPLPCSQQRQTKYFVITNKKP